VAVLIWYLARGAGIAGFAALSVATGAGAYAARRNRHLDRRVVWQYVHRTAALSGVCLLIGHVALLLADSFAHVGWVGALVPFASGYRPWQVTLGVLSAYCLLAVTLTGVLRRQFAQPERGAMWWRRIHLAAYLAWALSALHFLTAGTDSGTWWARAVLFGGVAVVAAGVIARSAQLASGPQLRAVGGPPRVNRRPTANPGARTGAAR
jgi:predicted ferric reductase